MNSSLTPAGSRYVQLADSKRSDRLFLEFATPRATPKSRAWLRSRPHEVLCRRPGEASSDPIINERERAQKLADYEEQLRLQKLTELSERTGMPVTQENGQRRYGPPIEPEIPLPPRGSEVFVGKVPRDCYEYELVPIFERAGRIYELRLMMDFSGTNRGYCFVHYFTPIEAEHAIRLLNGYEIRPHRRIGVVKSVDNCRLFIGNIPLDKGAEDIRKEMDKFTDGVVKVVCPPVLPDSVGRNRGYAFIEYESHKSAAMARRKFLPGKLKMWDIDVAVDWAEPEKEVQTLFLKNLSPVTTEESIYHVFNQASQNGVERVTRVNGCAFVNFYTRYQAEIAKSELENVKLDGSVVQILWARRDGSGNDSVRKPGKFRVEFDLYSRPIEPSASRFVHRQNGNIDLNHGGFSQSRGIFGVNDNANFKPWKNSSNNNWGLQPLSNRPASDPFAFDIPPKSRYFSPNAHYSQQAFDFYSSGLSGYSGFQTGRRQYNNNDYITYDALSDYFGLNRMKNY